MQKRLGTDCSRTNHYIRFCCKQLELDPRLKDLSLADQNIVAICYLDDLTRGNTYYGMRVQYSTLKQYMDTMASWVKIHTSRDIRIKPDLEQPRDQWKEHQMLETIYKDTKNWQGMSEHQDPITKLMSQIIVDLVVGSWRLDIPCQFFVSL